MQAPAHSARLRALGLILVLGALIAPAHAEDIDIYAEPNSASDVPNVLFVLDNSANWSADIPAPTCYYKEGGVASGIAPQDQGKKVAIEQCALYNLVDALPVGTSGGPDNNALFRIGIMMLNEPTDGGSGAYPRKAFTPLTTNNKAAFKTLIKSFGRTTDNTNNAELAKEMHEAYLYFKGLAPYQGQSGAKRDTAAFDGNHYNSPAGASCSRNYVIVIANGSTSTSENNTALALLTAAGGDVTPLSYPTSIVKSTDQATWMDEYARFMRSVDVSSNDGSQGIITHTVAVTGASSDGLYPNFMAAVANQGGGTYHSASDADTLLKALLEVFNEIQAVNSVFASASLPVSVIAVLPVLKPVAGAAPSVVPAAQPTQVSTLRESCEVAYVERRRCAAAPFSTTSPSGESLPDGGVPSSWLAQKVLAVVQNDTAFGLMKPVDELTAELPAESTSDRLPSVSRPNWYCLRLPRQRGLASPSGRNMPM